MASEPTSNLREEAVYRQPSPSSSCRECLEIHNSQQPVEFHCSKDYVPPKTVPLFFWIERVNPPSRMNGEGSWLPGQQFEDAIHKHIGKRSSCDGSSFPSVGDESVPQPNIWREPFSYMIDIPQGLADDFKKNPDKMEAFLSDLPQPLGCKWAYDLPSNGSHARSQSLSEALTPRNQSRPTEYQG